MEPPGIEDIRNYKSLDEIIIECQKAIHACDSFLEASGRKPPQSRKPLSQKAENFAIKITENQVEDIRGLREKDDPA